MGCGKLGWVPAKKAAQQLKDAGQQDKTRIHRSQRVVTGEKSAEPRTIRPGVRVAFVRAPDDVRIELLQRD